MSHSGPCRVLIATLLLGGGTASIPGCAVGPDFHRPSAPAASAYGLSAAATASAAVPGAVGPRLHLGAEVAAEWWHAFNSPQIDALVQEALRGNADLQAARDSLRNARETLAAQRATLIPALGLQASSVRQQDAAVLSPTLANAQQHFGLTTAQLTFDYPLDLFGGERRQIESTAASAEAQRWQVASTYLTLTSNTVIAAIDEAAIQRELSLSRQVAESARQSLDILRQQYQLGAVSQNDVDAQQALLSQAEALVPPLEAQLQQQRDLLAVLVGKLPADAPAIPLSLDALALPQDLPLSLPARVVERRPDIREAEAQLHAATAQVGVATANLLPNIALTGSAGSATLALSELAAPATRFWSLGASLSATLFDGGALRHRKRAAVAAMDQAASEYRSTVLQAFRQIADALAALRADAATLQAQTDAAAAAARTLQSVQRGLTSGSNSYLALLDAERTYRQAVVSQATAQAARLTDTVNLYIALGGGLAPDGQTP